MIAETGSFLKIRDGNVTLYVVEGGDTETVARWDDVFRVEPASDEEAFHAVWNSGVITISSPRGGIAVSEDCEGILRYQVAPY